MQYDENAEKYGYEGEMTPIECAELQAYKGDVTIPVYGTIADAEVYLKKDVDAAIAELKDKCQMHDFFWEGCGFKKLGFKNSINVRDYCDELKRQNEDLIPKCRKANKELRHNKYKRCLAMALLWLERAENSTDLENELVSRRRYSKWMELAEKFKKG